MCHLQTLLINFACSFSTKFLNKQNFWINKRLLFNFSLSKKFVSKVHWKCQQKISDNLGFCFLNLRPISLHPTNFRGHMFCECEHSFLNLSHDVILVTWLKSLVTLMVETSQHKSLTLPSLVSLVSMQVEKTTWLENHGIFRGGSSS